MIGRGTIESIIKSPDYYPLHSIPSIDGFKITTPLIREVSRAYPVLLEPEHIVKRGCV